MRYALVDGDARAITQMVRDGWKIENTFPNPNPQPYFYALMYIDHPNEDSYDINNVKRWAMYGHVKFDHGETPVLNQWGTAKRQED